jgi:hypothetical protein
MANSGYYEGACLDYAIQYYVAGNEVDEVDEDDLSYYGSCNNGLAKIIAPKANAWLEKTKDEITNDLEEVFSKSCGIELRPIATFSNGETIYEPVNK